MEPIKLSRLDFIEVSKEVGQLFGEDERLAITFPSFLLLCVVKEMTEIYVEESACCFF